MRGARLGGGSWGGTRSPPRGARSAIAAALPAPKRSPVPGGARRDGERGSSPPTAPSPGGSPGGPRGAAHPAGLRARSAAGRGRGKVGTVPAVVPAPSTGVLRRGCASLEVLRAGGSRRDAAPSPRALRAFPCLRGSGALGQLTPSEMEKGIRR